MGFFATAGKLYEFACDMRIRRLDVSCWDMYATNALRSMASRKFGVGDAGVGSQGRDWLLMAQHRDAVPAMGALGQFKMENGAAFYAEPKSQLR